MEQSEKNNNDTVRCGSLYVMGRALYRVCFSLFGNWQIEGKENIPTTGGVIMAPNHTSYNDPPLVGSAMVRPLFFMAKQELFEVPVLGFLIRQTNAFPVKRGHQDIAAIRMSQKVLSSGQPLLIFPEGTRSRDGAFGRARPGLGMVACHAQVPVVPVRVVNANSFSRKNPIRVVFGAPLYPPSEYTRESYQSFSEDVLNAIKKL